MNDRDRRPLAIVALISCLSLLGVMLFSAGVWAESNLFEGADVDTVAAGNLEAENATFYERFGEIDEVASIIESEYYDLPADPAAQEAFWEELESKAIQGLTNGLDGFSSYLLPVQADAFDDQMNGTYEGIGIWVAARDGHNTVVSTLPDSPAEEAGLLPGDILVAANGESLVGISNDDALEFVRGPAGTTVTLEIYREETNEQLTFELERRNLPTPVVLYQEIGDLGLITMAVFGNRTTVELEAAIDQAVAGGAKGLILDLRNNGGGWVQTAQETIGMFLPANTGVALVEDSDQNLEGEEESLPIVNVAEQITDLPLVVLIDGGTASSAEIVAGALQDYDRATIVGSQSFGKGSVQRVHDFEDGSSLRITFAHWLTPELREIDGVGITPDVDVSNEKTEGESTDEQLEAAVNELNSQISNAE